MANNRYYIKCPICKEEVFMGKSLGDGIYNMRNAYPKTFNSPEEILADIGTQEAKKRYQEGDAEVLNELYDFMWKHMIECHGTEFKGGELFKIVSEYRNELNQETT